MAMDHKRHKLTMLDYNEDDWDDYEFDHSNPMIMTTLSVVMIMIIIMFFAKESSPPLWFCLPFPHCLSATPSKLHGTDDDNVDDDDDHDDDDGNCYDDVATCAKASNIILI